MNGTKIKGIVRKQYKRLIDIFNIYENGHCQLVYEYETMNVFM